MLRETRVLCAARFGTARSISDMGNFVDLEHVTDVLGTQFTFVNIHELLDQTHIGKSGENYTLPGRAALNPTEEDVREMEALADDLIGNAQECDMTREEVLNSERFYITVKKMLDYYGCNAFAAPCPDACATRRLNEEHMTFCMTHSLLGEMGIPLPVSTTYPPACPSPSCPPWRMPRPIWATPPMTPRPWRADGTACPPSSIPTSTTSAWT